MLSVVPRYSLRRDYSRLALPAYCDSRLTLKLVVSPARTSTSTVNAWNPGFSMRTRCAPAARGHLGICGWGPRQVPVDENGARLLHAERKRPARSLQDAHLSGPRVLRAAGWPACPILSMTRGPGCGSGVRGDQWFLVAYRVSRQGCSRCFASGTWFG